MTHIAKAFVLLMGIALLNNAGVAQTNSQILDRGAKLLNEGKYRLAMDLFRNVVASDSVNRPRAYFLLALAYEKTDAKELALESFEQSLKLNYNRKGTGIRVVRLLSDFKKYDQAIQVLDSLRRDIDPELFTELKYHICMTKGDFRGAEKVLTESHSAFASESAVLAMRSIIALKESNNVEYRRNITALMKSYVVMDEPTDILFSELGARGLYDDAEKLLSQYLKKGKKESRYYEKLATLILLQGKDVDPKTILPDNTPLDVSLLDVCVQLSRKYESMKYPDGSIKVLDRIIDLKPDYYPAHVELLKIYYQFGYDQQGLRFVADPWLKSYRVGTEMQMAEWAYLAAKLYMRNRDPERAEENAQKAVASYRKACIGSPDSTNYLLKLSLSYLLTGDLSNAEIQMQMFLTKGSPSSGTIAKGELQKLVDERILIADANYLMMKYAMQPVTTAAQTATPTPQTATPAPQTVVPAPQTATSIPQEAQKPASRPVFQRDVVPPEIIVVEPEAARGLQIVQTETYSCPVSGFASDSEGVSVVYVGGISAQLAEASPNEVARYHLKGNAVKFTGEAMLAPGSNAVQIRAVDVNGNSTKKTLTIERLASVVPEPPPLPEKKLPAIWAVVVGISQYESKELQLAFADKDAQSVYGLLKGPAAGAVPDDHISFLTNRNATRAEILRAINEKLRLAFEEDEVIIYLACHGVPDEVTNELYFLCYDSQIENIIGTGISQLDIQKAISAARAKKVLLIVDACHSGGVGLAPAIAQRGAYALLTNKLLQELAQVRDGVAILGASSASEYSQEGRTWGGHGVFTHALIEGLEGKADSNKNGFITIREIYEYVYRKVADETSGKQHPNLGGKFDNDLPLTVVK